MTHTADIVIAGAGLSGLTLAVELAHRNFFADKRIVLIDRDPKKRNDRTWSFWATPDEAIPPVVHRSWNRCRFFAQDFELPMDMGHYQYHTARGIDFYNWALAQLDNRPNIQRVQANIEAFDAAKGLVRTSEGDWKALHIFNSALAAHNLLPMDERFPRPISPNHMSIPLQYSLLLQHFKGWVVRTKQVVFDPGEVRFMDFRVPQRQSVRFVYVLPFSETEALVEYTVFSEKLLADAEYDEALRQYMVQHLALYDYEVVDTEFGVIPMTDYPFLPRRNGNIWNIGTAAGFVKASSGYAFKRTLRKMRAFVDDWEAHNRPSPGAFNSPWRFRAYDSVLLRVLRDQPEQGARTFKALFSKLPAHFVLRFLDEDTTPAEELRVLATQPPWLFMKKTARQSTMLAKV